MPPQRLCQTCSGVNVGVLRRSPSRARVNVPDLAGSAERALTTSYPTAITGFAVLGLVNATSFTATLTARTRYAPPGARAQVFVTSAGLKIAMAALGAALAGATAELGGRALLICTAAITLTAVATALLDRRLTARKHRRREHAHVTAELRQERTSGV